MPHCRCDSSRGRQVTQRPNSTGDAGIFPAPLTSGSPAFVLVEKFIRVALQVPTVIQVLPARRELQPLQARRCPPLQSRSAIARDR